MLKKLPNIVTCPKCLSQRVRLVTVKEKVLIPERRKSTTKLNLNPFKPFTLFNTKESVSEAWTIPKYIYQCEKCNNVFERYK
jgi:hypothetical protein